MTVTMRKIQKRKAGCPLLIYSRNKSAETLKCFASVRTCASVNCRSPRRIIPPNVR
jgi:hypothetical protein